MIFTILAASTGEFSLSKLDHALQQLVVLGIQTGQKILAAVIIYMVGHYLIRFINRLVARGLNKTKMDGSVQSFLRSLINIILTVLLLITVFSALGINTTSFAALLASAGVAIGMALSGNLQNFAGGIIILVFRPYKVGDWIEAQNYQGRVKEVQIFHTIIQTIDNRLVYIPNGTMSTSLVVNHDQLQLRRAEWTVSISYGDNVEYARQLLTRLIDAEPMILTEPKDAKGNPLPAVFIGVKGLSASSVDLIVRAYVESKDYWDIFFHMQEVFYQAIDADPQLTIPFQTQTVHVVND